MDSTKPIGFGEMVDAIEGIFAGFVSAGRSMMGLDIVLRTLPPQARRTLLAIGRGRYRGKKKCQKALRRFVRQAAGGAT